MTKLLLLALGLLVTTSFAAEREIKIRTEKRKTPEGKDAIFWTPDRIEVVPGEKIKITATHDLPGGFAVHGLTIEPLKIADQVEFQKPLTLVRDVPKTFKVGDEIPVTCQFHPAHQPAKLVVVDKIAAPARK